jgi:hypothetical protein
VQRKTELVLRLLRGEALERSRATARCRRTKSSAGSGSSLGQGKRGLRTRAEPEERELILARAKIALPRFAPRK